MTHPRYCIGWGLTIRSIACQAARTADSAIISTMNRPARSSPRWKP